MCGHGIWIVSVSPEKPWHKLESELVPVTHGHPFSLIHVLFIISAKVDF